MIPTLETVVQGLISQGYVNRGGSDDWRLLKHKLTSQTIKVFYDNYNKPNYIVIKESTEGYEE